MLIRVTVYNLIYRITNRVNIINEFSYHNFKIEYV